MCELCNTFAGGHAGPDAAAMVTIILAQGHSFVIIKKRKESNSPVLNSITFAFQF